MLYLVISEPGPERPSAIAAKREEFWRWVQPMLESGEVRSVHARIGRGAVVLFDVPSHEALHRRLTEWGELVPARFLTYPLLDAGAAQAALARSNAAPG